MKTSRLKNIVIVILLLVNAFLLFLLLSRRAEEHVDARELGLGLHERAADLIHALGQILEDLGLRGDGIAAVKPAAGAQRRFCQGLIALHQLFAHVCTSYSRISKTLSGHTR